MDPEISRRCTVCGASIRSRAAFCPQCGQALKQPDSEIAETRALTQPPAEFAETKALDQDKPKTKSEFEKAQTIALNRAEVESAPTVALDRASVESTRGRAKATGVLGAENVRDRMDKLRKASHGVIDQAAYDPSVRFLLVAAAFLILFGILMLANRVLG